MSAKLDSILSGIFSGDMDANSEQVYDHQDRPLKFAQRACEVTKNFPFILQKARLNLIRAYIMKKDMDQALLVVKDAVETATEIYSSEHPLTAKLNNLLIEVLEAQPEDQKDTA